MIIYTNTIKQEMCEIFDEYYVESLRPVKPIKVENVMKFTLTDCKTFSCTPRRLSYEKSKLKIIIENWLKSNN